MKKIIYILCFSIVFFSLSIFPTSVYAKTEYNKGYELGQEIGEIVGEREGKVDFYQGLSRNWKRSFPSDESIEKEYRKLIGGSDSDRYTKGFVNGYEESYEHAYNKIYKETYIGENIDQYSKGYHQGAAIGASDGKIKGIEKFRSGGESDWEQDVEKNYVIIDRYQLARENEQYEEGFLQGYREGFQKSYVEYFLEKLTEESKSFRDLGYAHGSARGEEDGKMKGSMDFTNQTPSDWTIAMGSDYDINVKYGLYHQTKEYIEGFLKGYKETFPMNYKEAYAEASLSQTSENEKKWEVDMFGKTIHTSDKKVILDIDQGTLYENRFFSIQKGDFPDFEMNDPYIPVTPTYTITIDQSTKLQKPLQLSFFYSGETNAGIYEWKDGRWVYLPSSIEKTRSDETAEISAEIDTSLYSGGKYIVLIDKGIKILEDIQGHWAEKAITILLRRHFISGYPDGTFRPTNTITRAEFITVLNRMGKLQGSMETVDVTSFKDYTTFGVYLPHIQRAVETNLVHGYPDGTFRPNIPITYQEAQWMIQRLPGWENFLWIDIANKIMNEKDVRSRSFDGMNRHITRAEAAYLFSILDQ